jgi:hypothetical protein
LHGGLGQVHQVYHSEWRYGGIIKGGGNSMEADLKRLLYESGFEKALEDQRI